MKFLHEYLPIIVFFLTYKLAKTPDPLITATIALLLVTVVVIALSKVLGKKIPAVSLFSAFILAIFGGLTIILKDEIFIKLKPTIINLIFSAILFYGYLSKKPLLSYILGEQIKISHQAWLTLSLRWALFFVFLAILNEIIWRSFSTEFWVQFKLFGMMPISVIFTISQAPFLIREIKRNNP